MSKKLILAGIFIIAVALSGFLALRNKGEMKAMEQKTVSATTTPVSSASPAPQQTAAPVEEEVKSDTPGKYVDYSQNVIATTAGTKLLFFHAPWCPQCRALEADIKSKDIPTGVTIIKVDYDSNQQLRKKYGVTIQTTVVRVNDNGELIAKYVAYDEPTLASVTANLL